MKSSSTLSCACLSNRDPASASSVLTSGNKAHLICFSASKVNVQVISADLNKVVAEFLQQLLYWQERTKAMNPMKAKNKRLVSGLREVSIHSKLMQGQTTIWDHTYDIQAQLSFNIDLWQFDLNAWKAVCTYQESECFSSSSEVWG